MAAGAAIAGLEVRLAEPADFDDLLQLFERFYREEGFEAAIGGLAKNLRQILSRDDTAALVARIEGKAAGAAAMSSAFGLEAGFYAELEDLFVDPAWRGRGVASALVEAAASWARARGCRDLEIVLTPHAQAKDDLAPWYEARGFVSTGRIIYERAL
ncbi:GNAT family N-acetyltransferase [Pelagibius sp. CAU 1746]|uniref:GNAT family N-acetyltransferase n=1 Tax=Pelagibius sp. CAU 1746 TaxID=3140370 RepID=UPI00325BDF40